MPGTLAGHPPIGVRLPAPGPVLSGHQAHALSHAHGVCVCERQKLLSPQMAQESRTFLLLPIKPHR